MFTHASPIDRAALVCNRHGFGNADVHTLLIGSYCLFIKDTVHPNYLGELSGC